MKVFKTLFKSSLLILMSVFTLQSSAQIGYLNGLTNSGNKDKAAQTESSTIDQSQNELLNNATTEEALRRALIGILSPQTNVTDPNLPNNNNAVGQNDSSNNSQGGNTQRNNTQVNEENRHSYLQKNQIVERGDWALSSYFDKEDENNKLFELVNQIGNNIAKPFNATIDNWHYFGPQLQILKRKILDYRGNDGLVKLLSVLLLTILFGVLVERIIYFFIKRKRDAVYVLCNLAKENSDREELESLIDNNKIEIVKDGAENNQTTRDEAETEELTDVNRLDIALRQDDELRLTLMTKVKAVVSLFFIDGLRLGGFAAGAFILPNFFFGNDTVLMKEFITACITQLVTFGFFVVIFRSFIQPKCDYLRMFSLKDSEAVVFYRVVMTIFFMDTFGIGTLIYLDRWGIDFNFLVIPMFIITTVINVYVIYHTWRAKSSILKIFVAKLDTNGRQIIGTSNFYPIIITFGVLWIWFHWFYFLINQQFDTVKILGLAWWITLFFPLIDRVFFIITNGIVSIYTGDSRALKRRIARIVKVFQIAFRYFLGLVIIYLYLSAIDITKVHAVSHFISELLTDVSVVFAFSYIIWELVHGYIEHRFPEEENTLASLDGEGGAGGASRSETIMPLVRSFLSVILLVIILMVALSSFGVEIGPLLAGAGIVGIAIGFGAQKLVQDILSGIFFLVDDAFRKGEYIEIEELRGTVEKIALRSMQLRHHLGAVQTIPYGEIKTVKNLSRDWITMKLELRFPYDTDIEAVRKIIKKVGQAMLEDEEMGPSFILPLKSQGVMRVEESALIVRMKFTTKPGEQWVIRREAYRRVKEALEAEGIFFAHREVFVRLPGEASSQGHPMPVPMPIDDNMPHDMDEDDMPEKEAISKANLSAKTSTHSGKLSEADQKKLKEVGAAVASSILASEALKQGKIQDDDRDFSE